MNTLEFKFSANDFNKLFPFYILIDKSLKVISIGKSLAKLYPELDLNSSFIDFYQIQRPLIDNPTFQDIVESLNKTIILESKQNKLTLRGQFELHKDNLLFIGTPWVTSMSQVAERNLIFSDFASHDPLLDLLHLLNKYENTSNDLKELLNTVNDQRNELKNDQEKLNRLSLVASANENGIVFTKPDGEIFWCNEAYLRLTEYQIEDVIGKTPIELGLCEETDLEELNKLIEPFYKGEPFYVDLIHAKKSGNNFWTRIKGQPIFDKEGNLTQYFAMLEDITEKKLHEERLEIEKNKYQSIIANMNLGLIEVDLNDKISLVNQSFVEISGYSEKELIGRNASKLFLTEESQALIKEKKRLRKEGISDSFEVKVITKEGKKKTWLLSGAPNYDLQGNLIGSIGIHLDITEQKEQEERLFLLSLIAEKNINAVVICDKEGKIEWVNKSFIEMSGFSSAEIIGKKPGHILQGIETNLETVKYLSDQIKKGLPFNCEVLNYTKTREKYWVSIQGQALYNKEGEILKFFAIEEDITQKKILEDQREELVQSLAKSNQELEDYAAIVSHDLKSPLRSIHSLLSWIKEDNDKIFSEETHQYFSMIENKVEKMDYLIDGILTYAKIDKIDVSKEKVNINEIVKNIIDIIHIPENINVIVKKQLPQVRADRFRMQQLFQNLISNAVNYIDKPQGKVEIDFKENKREYIFSIKDNGPGIAKENQENIFKIFQSFTSSDKSTGLGLSIVKKIIEKYNGKIWMESELQKGTTFFIQLKK